MILAASALLTILVMSLPFPRDAAKIMRFSASSAEPLRSRLPATSSSVPGGLPASSTSQTPVQEGGTSRLTSTGMEDCGLKSERRLTADAVSRQKLLLSGHLLALPSTAKMAMREAIAARKVGRARVRQAKALTQKRIEGMTILESLSVKVPTWTSYEVRVKAFSSWCSRNLLELKAELPVGVEMNMIEYFDHLYMEGESVEAGEKTLAGWAAFYPTYSKGGIPLPRVLRALKGWRKSAPGGVRNPCPQLACTALAGSMATSGHPEMALFILTSFSSYGRPGEIFNLRGKDVIPPVKPYLHYTLELAPSEMGISTKAGQYDDAVLLDDPDMPWLGDLLWSLARTRLDRSLWDFSMRELIDVFLKHSEVLDLSGQIVCLYQMRHGGASHDKFTNKRDMPSIQRRGRWNVVSSLKRYEKHGRVQQLLNKMMPSLREYGAMALVRFPDMFHKRASLPPPVRAMKRKRGEELCGPKLKGPPASSRSSPAVSMQRKLLK
jgi:hypothetical protein